MRVFKLVAALILLPVLSAIVVATASAAETLWSWLPGAAKTAFTGKSGKLTFQIKGGASITAPEATMTGELTESQTLGLALLTMSKATTSGIPINSEGDASGIILLHVETHNCRIKTGEGGILVKLLPVHLEAPSIKLLFTMEGSYIASSSGGTGKVFTLVVSQTGGTQAIEKCEGGAVATLSTSVDGSAFTQTGLEGKEVSLTFTSVEQETMEGTVGSETLWRWLPGATGTKFTGTGGKALWQVKGGLSITSPSSTTTGEITEGGGSLGLALISFTKSTTAGLPVNSLGDASGVILVHLELHNCLIKAGSRGLLMLALPVHLEVPSTKLLVNLEGGMVALIGGSKSKTFTLSIEQKEGVQAIEKCEGGAAQTLKTSVDGGASTQTGFEAKELSITFTTIEEEVMES